MKRYEQSNLFIVLLLSLFVINVFTAEPNPPVWPSSVYVLNPATPSTSQNIIDQIFAQNGGPNPPFNGQWSNSRYALLFLPGVHNVTMNVGYYTSVIGLGQQPSDTNIQTVVCQNGDFDYSGGALSNFWRSAENFYTKPIVAWNNSPSPSMLWAVSQACPLRRVYVDGDLNLFQYNSGCCAGYSSGGYLADSTVSGTITSGSQQQFYVRNTQAGTWTGGNWNMVFQGNTGGYPGTHCSNSAFWPITSIPQTPIIAEKPYLTINTQTGKYSIVVPNLQSNKVGPTTVFTNAKSIDLSSVYVATESDTADTINAKLNQGLHLLLTPGNYNLTSPIIITQSSTVVLGIGFPTLISAAGNPVIVVQSVPGVKIAGVLLQAGPINADSLLIWGNNDRGDPSNPGFLYDCFARVGGTNNPSIQQVMASTMIKIQQDNVVIDNAWLWRADHDITGEVYDGNNPCDHGLQVYSDNVITYGLAVEHQLNDLVQWYGNNGQVYFYQSELPYDVTQQNFGDPAYVGFRVDPSVSAFQGWGMGVYCYFRDYTVVTTNGIYGPGQFTNSLSVFLNGNGQITYTVNNQGTTVNQPAETSYVC